MRLENGTLIMEKETCYGCMPSGSGRVPIRVTCPTCNGTQRGARGGRRTHAGTGCKTCIDGTVYSKTEFRPCSRCKGTGLDSEDYCSRIPMEVWRDLEFRVIRSNRSQSMNEALLGVGCCWSTTDYGDHKRMSDEELIAKVRDDRSGATQATNVVRSKDDLRIADAIGIFCNDNGYSVRAIFDDLGESPEEQSGINKERTYTEGLIVGAAISRAGGNGTLGALYRD